MVHTWTELRRESYVLMLVLLLQEEEGGGASEETRFYLPCNPSSGVMMLLLAASRELQRAGMPLAGSSALEILLWELSKALVAAFK